MNRDRAIDFFKVLLVVGMIIAHSIQFLGDSSSKIQQVISTFVNLITFSGFMFCFGYATNIAYMKKTREEVSEKLIRGAIKILVVFYISGIAYKLLVSKNLNIVELIKIILLFRIPGYSEFLLSFSVLNLVILIFFNLFKKSLQVNKTFLLIIAISLLATFIPYELVILSQIGIIIGTTKFACFPILQYICYFMFGLYFNQNKIKFNIKFLLLSLLGSLSFILYTIVNRELPSRFPPSIVWVIGASFFLYMYYLASKYLSNKINFSKHFYFIGENTLYFLLTSNLILFTLEYFMPTLKFSLLSSIISALVILIVSYIIIYLNIRYVIKPKGKQAGNMVTTQHHR